MALAKRKVAREGIDKFLKVCKIFKAKIII